MESSCTSEDKPVAESNELDNALSVAMLPSYLSDASIPKQNINDAPISKQNISDATIFKQNISDAPIAEQNNQSPSSIEDSSGNSVNTTPSSKGKNANVTSSGAKPYKSDRPGYLNEVYRPYHKAMESNDFESLKYLLEDTVYLINTDTGGQTEYLDLMSRFIMGPALNLIFSRLTDPLDKVYKIYYTNEDGVSTEEEDSIITLEEVFFQALASIACMEMTKDFSTQEEDSTKAVDEEVKMSECSSKAMFVGTFRDKVYKFQVNRRNRHLREKIEQTDFYKMNIVKYASTDNVLLTVDNLHGDLDEINNLRSILEACIKDNFKKVHIPFTWLMLSINMRSENKRTMLLSELQGMAFKLGIQCSDLKKILWFLHYRVGVLLHYPDLRGFEEIIICDVKVCFIMLKTFCDKIKILLLCVYFNCQYY